MASVLDSSDLSSVFSALADTSYRQSASTTALNNGLTYLQNKNYSKAVAAFKLSVVYNADNATGYNTDAYNYMAQAFTAMGKSKDAVAAYRQSLELDRTQDDIHVAIANLQIQDNRLEDAKAELKAAIRTNPQNVVAPYTLAHLLIQQDKPGEAESYFRSAARLSPNDGNVYYGLGLALEKQGKTDDAVQALQKAVSLKKDFSAAIYELGVVYADNGQKDLAQAQIDALDGIDTDESASYADTLAAQISQPRIVAIDNTSKSSFNTLLGTVPLIVVDSQFIQPGASKEMSVTFEFDSDMDVGSVNNISNWSIGKAQGVSINPSTGLYDNGLRRATDTAISPMPTRVSYDPTTNKATIYFSLTQNSSATGTIDTSRIIFSFKGQDLSGRKMDPAADQINGFSDGAF